MRPIKKNKKTEENIKDQENQAILELNLVPVLSSDSGDPPLVSVVEPSEVDPDGLHQTES